jgi:hypothetical protein
MIENPPLKSSPGTVERRRVDGDFFHPQPPSVV